MSIMDAKLTLKLSEEVISRAKRYAREKNTSLSRMIESYLDALTRKGVEKGEITPLVKSLSGVIKLPEGYNYKDDKGTHLDQKHE
jgi:hypothetical protein